MGEEKQINQIKNRVEFDWMLVVDNLSELTRETMSAIYEKNVYEFLNLYSYLIWKNRKLEQQYKKQ